MAIHLFLLLMCIFIVSIITISLSPIFFYMSIITLALSPILFHICICRP
jgi:hypothetical protein